MTWGVMVVARGVMVVALLVAPEAPEPEVMPIKQDTIAPFSGLLVPETRFVELLEAEQWARELEIRVDTLERTSEAVEAVYQSKLEGAGVVPWYDSPTFNRWLGIIVGGAIAGVAVWAAVEVQAAHR